VADRDRLADRGEPARIEAFPVKPGSATKPVPGYDVRVLDEEGNESPRGKSGAIAIKLPLPPGTLPTLYQDEATFESAYLARYPGYYLTGDGGYYDSEGYLSIMGRIDDVINVAGHRLSTGSMEEVLAAHKDVAECAVVGVNDAMKGEVPVGFVVLKAGVSRPEAELCAELVALVRERIGPVAFFKTAAWCRSCPRRARERSCAGPFARSPTAPLGRCRPPSRTRPRWTR
jgi:propionyl-CoA synthetase